VRTLRETDLPPGVNSVKWDGKDDRGNRAESAYYTIEVSAVDAAGEAITPSTFVSGKVSGVVYHDGAAFLKVNGLEIALADVSAIDKSEE
jgi:flagellar basal-body rod modification protein FlgD